MKKGLMLVVLMALAGEAWAQTVESPNGPAGEAPPLSQAMNPPIPTSHAYIQGLWTKGNPIYTEQTVALMPSTLSYDRTFTSIAFAYHPISAGSILNDLPENIQPIGTIIPPESWACTLGGSYAPSSGVLGASGGIGCGFNLLDSFRGVLGPILQKSSNATISAIGTYISPTSGDTVNLFFSRQYDDTFEHPGRLAPRWATGLGFAF